ncbi:ATP-binding protein [Staphylospora marina]|uniref:ATP-binding protein n=1 Tax=Staphylospora marina TaxID=2490858 RepID=UPI000F5B947C|nr:ATP-binding protein [Staphylospora marina]
MKQWMRLVNSVQWKLVVIYILLIITALQLIGVYFFRELEEYLIRDVNDDLRLQAGRLSQYVKTELSRKTSDNEKRKEISKLLDTFRFLKNAEIRVIDKNNFVIASTAKQQQPDFVRPAFPFNVQKPETIYRTWNAAKGVDYQGYILQLVDGGKRVGAIQIEMPLDKTYKTIRDISKILIKITFFALVLTSFLVVILARTITSPVKEITEQATAMASGDFDRQVSVKSGDEIGRLAMAFNHLAAHLRVALKQKEEETEKLQSVLANMSDGVIATDGDGRVIVKNLRAENLLERRIQLGEPLESVLPLTEPVRLPLREERHLFLEWETQDGEPTILKVTLTPVKMGGDDRMTGLVAVLEDVTEQEKLDRQRKEFVANVSHELRTPLTTIKSYLEALEDGAVHEPELATRFLKVTRQEADRMTRLIQDLLTLSRLDARKERFQKRPLSTLELLDDAYQRFTFQCRQKSIDLTLYVPPGIRRVYADRDKIDQVLDNLISNAVKYTPEGGSIAITARTRPDGMVEVGVADTGIGIPKKDLGRIFERFYRVDKARSRELGGTGLGLAIAREIIRAHDGDIRIESVWKKGTLVTFTLPTVSGRWS